MAIASGAKPILKAPSPPHRPANFDCRCGRPMVWLKGHAVCSGCDDFWPKCECAKLPVDPAALDDSLSAR